MPPTALAGIFAAQIVGMDKYTPVLKKSLVPGIVVILYSIVIILLSNKLGSIIF